MPDFEARISVVTRAIALELGSVVHGVGRPQEALRPDRSTGIMDISVRRASKVIET